MTKMNNFISKHGKKVALTAVVGGIVSFSFANQAPSVSDVYASSKISNHVKSKLSMKSSKDITAFASNPKAFALDTVFITTEYDPDIPREAQKPVAGVEIEVYSSDTDVLVARGTSDKTGRYVIKNLPEGNYKWVRTHVPDRYIPMTKDKEINGPKRYGYLSIHPLDEDKIILSDLDVKVSILEEEGRLEGSSKSAKPTKPTPPVAMPPTESATETPELPGVPPVSDTEEPGSEVGSETGSKTGAPISESPDGDTGISNDGTIDTTSSKGVDAGNSEDVISVESAEEDKSNTDKSDPDDVQTYDKGVVAFVAMALFGIVGIVILGKKKRGSV